MVGAKIPFGGHPDNKQRNTGAEKGDMQGTVFTIVF